MKLEELREMIKDLPGENVVYIKTTLQPAGNIRTLEELNGDEQCLGAEHEHFEIIEVEDENGGKTKCLEIDVVHFV